MFDALKAGFKRALNIFTPRFKAVGENVPTLRDMRLDSDEWYVKQKLGRSFFTRRLSENTRHARIASLTGQEYDLAKNRGWL